MWTIIGIAVAIISGLVCIGNLMSMIKGLKSPESIAEEGEEVLPRTKIFFRGIRTTAITGTVFAITIVLMTDKGADSNTKSAKDYYTESLNKAKSDGRVLTKKDSNHLWRASVAFAKSDSLYRLAERYEDRSLSYDQNNAILRMTRSPVYEYLNARNATVIEFPERWDALRYVSTNRDAVVKRDSVIIGYLVRYPIKYIHKGVPMETDVIADVSLNLYNDKWTLKRTEMPDFNKYWAQTPEGRKALIEAMRKSGNK